MSDHSDDLNSDIEELLLASVNYESALSTDLKSPDLASTNEDGELDYYSVQSDAEDDELTKYNSFRTKTADLILADSDLGSSSDENSSKRCKNTSLPQSTLSILSFDYESPSEIYANPSKQFQADNSSDSDDISDTRYFTECKGPTCFECGTFGHISKECPKNMGKIICYLCASNKHTKANCSQEFCYNCDFPGHTSRACPFPRKKRHMESMRCSICDVSGHCMRDCSMVWRRYSYDKRLSENSFGENMRKVKKYCYWCGNKGHFGDDCMKRRKGLSIASIFQGPTYAFLKLTIGKQPSESGRSKNSAKASASNNKNPFIKGQQNEKDSSNCKLPNSKLTTSGSVNGNTGNIVNPQIKVNNILSKSTNIKPNLKTTSANNHPPPPPLNALNRLSPNACPSLKTRPNLPTFS